MTMRKIKKVLALCLAIVCLATTTALAAEAQPAPTQEGIAVVQSEEAIEYEWHYRQLPDGRIQTRLWCVTYGYWVNEWEDVSL
jgi:hypothetical protein